MVAPSIFIEPGADQPSLRSLLSWRSSAARSFSLTLVSAAFMFPCFQITTRCFVRQLSEAGFELGHLFRAIFPSGNDFLFRNLPEQLWDPGSPPRAPTGVTRTPFLESRCLRWCFVTNLILSILCHRAPPLDRGARQSRRKLLFPRCAFPIF